MEKIKTEKLYVHDFGHYRCPEVDDYVYSRHTVADLLRYTEETNRLLYRIGAELTYVEHRVLPFIAEGIISPPLEKTCFLMNDCLIDNIIRPKDNGLTHQVSVASQSFDFSYRIQQLLLKWLHPFHREIFHDQSPSPGIRGFWQAGYELELPPEFQLTRFWSVKEAIDYITSTQS